METKFAMLILIASILTMAVYTSSINFVSAKVISMWTCGRSVDKPNQASCTITNNGVRTDYNCTYDATTKKWSCVKAAAKISPNTPNQMPGSETLNKLTDSQIPLGLKSALDSAIKSQNGGLVTGQSNTQNSNSSESTINNSPKLNTGPPPPGGMLGDGG
jgi:hypothetical protein